MITKQWIIYIYSINVSKFLCHCRNLDNSNCINERSYRCIIITKVYRGYLGNVNSRDSWTWSKKQYIESTCGSSLNPASGGFIDAASHKLQLLLSSRSSHEMISSNSTFFMFVHNFYIQFLRFFILEKVLREFRSRGWILWSN